MRKQQKHKQPGFTLVELMVSIVIAMIATASVISVFANSVSSNSSSLKSIRLNQELRAIMDVMVRDVRRSGYWSAANGTNAAANPFATLTINASTNCITYSYDVDDDGINDANAKQGFKYVNSGVALRKSSASCADTGGNNWEMISDTNTINVTNLNFNLTTSCFNVSAQSVDCSVAGDSIIYMNVVDITLQAQLAGDAAVADTIIETVAVRNTVSGVAP